MHSKARAQPCADLFELRGIITDQDLQDWPYARRPEFEQLLQMIPFHGEMVAEDVPTRGGYLQRCLPTSCIWLGHEPCATSSDHHASAKGAEIYDANHDIVGVKVMEPKQAGGETIFMPLKLRTILAEHMA